MKMSKEELNKILEEHKVWIKSGQMQGCCADLSDADLSDANLSDANLSYANLVEANLSNANLSGANLYSPDLSDANLSGANLNSATLYCANLSDANLSDANLNSATLYYTNLHSANLSGADLVYANISETIFANTDLSTVLNLHTCMHRGPSSIDYETLKKSGPLPRVFLQGCGLPDDYIDYLPSLLGEAIQFYDCFISYSSEDDDFAQKLHSDLQGKGIRCWFAPHDLKIGDQFRDAIELQVRLKDKLLLILSESSITSKWVRTEVETAFDQEIEDKLMLFPIRIDETVMETNKAWAADIRRTRHIGDFTNWKDHDAYKVAFDRLLRDLKRAPETDT